ncbi:hypothetical protein [Lactiplantibacillus carotarum]|uniref:hypothetical protein n=1 Tax=Lactiplantibacillus carotarum TaxID=2993456 RepID=UPI00298F0B54|nr:hypothetical protein [Lactiplantibacillus carotarum]
MSVADILLTTQSVLKNNYFPSEYNGLLKKVVRNSSLKMQYSRNVFIFNGHNLGQYISIRSSSDGKNIVVGVANYPNKKINLYDETQKLYSILN